MAKTTRLAVPDISCDHCKRSIEGALGPLDGVERAEVDVPGRLVTVVHDESLAAEALVAAVEDQGYEVAGRDGEER